MVKPGTTEEQENDKQKIPLITVGWGGGWEKGPGGQGRAHTDKSTGLV